MAEMRVRVDLIVDEYGHKIVDAVVKGMDAANASETYASQDGVYGHFVSALNMWLNEEFGETLGERIYNAYPHGDHHGSEEFMSWLEQWLSDQSSNLYNVG